MNRVRYEDSSHSYYIGTNRYPSVTECLQETGMLPSMEFARTVTGTMVHKLTAADDKGDVGAVQEVYKLASVTPGGPARETLERYLLAWRSYKKNLPPHRMVSIEVPRIAEALGFGWTADRILLMEESKRFRVVEIKTGGMERWHRLQTRAYALGLREVNTEEEWKIPQVEVSELFERSCIYLSGQGSYTEDLHSDKFRHEKEDREIFLSALSCCTWRIREGIFWR